MPGVVAVWPALCAWRRLAGCQTQRGAIVDSLIGKKILISGMAIEIVSDEGDQWQTRNMTTKETVFFDKKTLRDAIKLGKAEEISGSEDGE